MNGAQKILQKLRSPLLVTLVMLALSGGLLAMTYRLLEGKKHNYQNLETRISEFRESVKQELLNEQWANEFQQGYSELIGQAVVGKEDRLEWSESLKEVSRTIGIQDLNFTISQQRPFIGRQPGPPGMAVFHSDMTISASLLHSGELVRLLSDLQQREVGLAIANNCELHQETAKLDISSNPSLTAICLLRWITLTENTSALDADL